MNGKRTGEELVEERYCRIGEVAEATGVSRRVLRRWDEIGLVSPSRTWSGYREYGPDDLERLRRVMVYRELGFDSDRIREVLDAPVAAVMGEMEDSRVALEGKIVELQEILKTLNKLISLNQAEEGFEASDSTPVSEDCNQGAGEDDGDWSRQARTRWAGSREWLEYSERVVTMSRHDRKEAGSHLVEVESDLAEACRGGVDPRGEVAMDLAERHRGALYWYRVTPSMHCCLARMYEADGRFRHHYEELEPGLTNWLVEAIDCNARRHGLDPAKTIWR
ncbi:MerR family transcriptional regulator [Bifidobacterium indicum]|uniref:MerR family transcriptional regulator n=1 Tax=Bifidobacterium indicum TaxID=1691 RepID=UPI0030D978F9